MAQKPQSLPPLPPLNHPVTLSTFASASIFSVIDCVSVISATTGALSLLLGWRIERAIKKNFDSFASGIMKGTRKGGRRNFLAEFFVAIFIVPLVCLAVGPFIIIGTLIVEAWMPLLVLSAAQMLLAWFFDEVYWRSVRLIGLVVVPAVTLAVWPQLLDLIRSQLMKRAPRIS